MSSIALGVRKPHSVFSRPNRQRLKVDERGFDFSEKLLRFSKILPWGYEGAGKSSGRSLEIAVLVSALLFASIASSCDSEDDIALADPAVVTPETASETIVEEPTPERLLSEGIDSQETTLKIAPQPTLPPASPAGNGQPIDASDGLDSYLAECERTLAENQEAWSFLALSDQGLESDDLAAMTWGQYAAFTNKAASDFEYIKPPPEYEQYHSAQIDALRAIHAAVATKPPGGSFGAAFSELIAELFTSLIAIAFDVELSEEEKELARDMVVDDAMAKLFSRDFVIAAAEVESVLAQLPEDVQSALDESCGVIGVGAGLQSENSNEDDLDVDSAIGSDQEESISDVGDSKSIGELDVAVLSGGKYRAPESFFENDANFRVLIQIFNTRGSLAEPAYLNSHYVTILGDDGIWYSHVLCFDCDISISDFELGPNGSAEGSVFFAIPDEITINLVAIEDPSTFPSVRHYWNLRPIEEADSDA